MSDSLRPLQSLDYSLPGSSVHGILQARILEWVAISFSRGSYWPRNQTPSLLHCRQILYWLNYEGRFNSIKGLKTFCVSLEVEPTPKQQYCFLAVSTLSLHPLSSLISNCLNPPFGPQGRSRRLIEAYVLQTRNGEHTTDLYFRAPQSST